MACLDSERMTEELQIKASRLQSELNSNQAQELQQVLEQMQAQMEQSKQLVNLKPFEPDSEEHMSEVSIFFIHHGPFAIGVAIHSKTCFVYWTQTTLVLWVQVKAYAKYLGFDLETDSDLLYIAKWAMEADLPHEWVANLDEDGSEYFYNQVTGMSQYSHPCDKLYKTMYLELKTKGLSRG